MTHRELDIFDEQQCRRKNAHFMALLEKKLFNRPIHHFWMNIKFHNKIFILGIIVYVLTAFMSSGYYHADEHYQIIEFAGIIEGTNEAKDLAWEYHEKIRSTIQPVLAYLIFKCREFLNVSSPYSKAFILRLITALLSLGAIFYFAESCKKMVPAKYWKLFLVLSYFLWFLPFLSVRFSSEAWSGIFLLFAAGIINRDKTKNLNYASIGILLGLSFLFRFQIAFAIAGIILWLFFIKKEAISKISIAILSFILVLLLGMALDSWFYGEWTMSLKNYIVSNLIDGKAASFGVSPWYQYFFLIFRYAFFPIGIVLLLSAFIVVLKRHHTLIVWIIIPFFIGHSLVAHKEFRFLFPLINFAPLIIIMALALFSIDHWNDFAKRLTKVLFIGLLSFNMICLVVVSLMPAGIGRVKITEKIHDINNKKALHIISYQGGNPYKPWGASTNFYGEANAQYFTVNAYMADEHHYDRQSTKTVLVFSQAQLKDKDIQSLIQKMKMTEICKSLPDFSQPFLRAYGYKTNDILVLYSD